METVRHIVCKTQSIDFFCRRSRTHRHHSTQSQSVERLRSRCPNIRIGCVFIGIFKIHLKACLRLDFHTRKQRTMAQHSHAIWRRCRETGEDHLCQQQISIAHLCEITKNEQLSRRLHGLFLYGARARASAPKTQQNENKNRFNEETERKEEEKNGHEERVYGMQAVVRTH